MKNSERGVEKVWECVGGRSCVVKRRAYIKRALIANSSFAFFRLFKSDRKKSRRPLPSMDLRLACREIDYEREPDYSWIKNLRIGFTKMVQIFLFVTFLRLILEAHVVEAYPPRRSKRGKEF